jgi:ParB family transcriptional regulator, chromosome partitioning protein
MTTRRGLGRGLEALIPGTPTEASGYARLPLEEIKPNPHQPRASFDEAGLALLAESIAEVGVLQPVVVRSVPGGFQLIAGERRWRAARKAGLHHIPAVIREGDDRASLTEALVENLQREDLSPLEEAGAYQQLLEDFGYTHEEVGRRVGRSRSAVTNTLRLLQLPPTIQGMLERGELSAGHARSLLGVEDRAFVEHVARRAVEEGWSVRQVEEAVRLRQGTAAAGGQSTKVRQVRPAEVIELEHRLTDHLGNKVKVEFRNGKGTVHIGYSSIEELEKLYRRLIQ